MKCISCDTEINPKWKHAIEKNVCPFCGSSILDEKLIGLLNDMMFLMSDLQSYPDQLNDWMLSNFNFIKTDSPNLINYLSPEDKDKILNKKKVVVKGKDGEEEVIVEKIQTDDKTAEFFKRSQFISKNGSVKDLHDKTQSLKEIAAKIKSGQQEDFLLKDALTKEQINDLSSGMEESSFDESKLDSFDAIDPIMEQFAKSNTYNAKDVAAFQRQQQKRIDSMNSVLNGDNRGKGGFSRAD